ncbi:MULTISPECIES: hypothetical protein [Kitasatospora]|uniref:Uncharacterized protein n=1 Tax=Kitasatospora setae (strain ATCC 33774 / DSM 43861 / JCM 3304 / KCC A-0304 / NBRC 14216 / KM-6054) TaxID=452652 RepID=E4NF35_KITSK|nr:MULTISPECIES: hypothetical protein [Kitasatospora]BAJ30115.1 hypothetical protein KSE_43310 [Kitasatospora setae KM-6054]
MYGRDPVNGGFGANVLPTASGVGHFDYWNSDGASPRTKGRVITGGLD